MVELADTLDLGSSAERRGGSTPSIPTIFDKANVSRVSINAIENGVYVPSAVLALRIAKVLKCSVEDIFQLP